MSTRGVIPRFPHLVHNTLFHIVHLLVDVEHRDMGDDDRGGDHEGLDDLGGLCAYRSPSMTR